MYCYRKICSQIAGVVRALNRLRSITESGAKVSTLLFADLTEEMDNYHGCGILICEDGMLRRKFFSTLAFRTSTATGADRPPNTQHRHVSLANIATAFLSERKSSSRRQPSSRRKKRMTIEKKKSHSRRQSTYSSGTETVIGQRLSGDKMENSIATILMVNSGAVGGNNKHRTTMVSRCEFI